MKNEVMIAGWGDVGKAIGAIVAAAGNELYILDPQQGHRPTAPGILDFLHITFPCYGKARQQEFITEASRIIKENEPDLTMIEASVPVGTTRIIAETTGARVVNSPVRGLHQELEKAIRGFIKYIGGEAEPVRMAINYYAGLGLKPYHAGDFETTELLKLLSTSYFGWNLLFAKMAKRYCDRHGVDLHSVYTHPNISYNEGYQALNHPQFTRPILTPPPTPIGGKCVTQNINLLEESIFTEFFELLNRLECKNIDLDQKEELEKK